MHSNKIRQYKQQMKRIIPKKVRVTSVGASGFCKYGRVYGDDLQFQSVMIVPIKGNPNNNWKIG